MGDQEANYGYIKSTVYVDTERGEMEDLIAVGTSNPEEHRQIAKATRYFRCGNDYTEELTYNILPFVTSQTLERSKLDMATYPPGTGSA